MDCGLRWVLCPAILLGAVAAAPTQAQGPSAPPTVLAPKPCADATTQGRGASRLSEGGSANQDLSQKLAEGNGVLCPPPTGDPIVERPPPNAGRTPVIPAPGTPGGDPNVQPK
jgi:hypothetical protein